MKAERYIIYVAVLLGITSVASLALHPSPESGAGAVADDGAATNVQPVNALVGDAGYLAAFGALPDANVSEDLRIETHLAYVERLLRARPVDHLTPEQVRQRRGALDHLRSYRTRGGFPRNMTHPGRRIPVFIDGEGRICAVGYLVEQTSGRASARAINDRFQYAYISEMDSPELPNWAEQNGFTLQELGMIQPTYCGNSPPGPGCLTDEDESTNAAVGLASLGLNATSALLNGWMVSRQKRNLLVAGGGLLAGGAGLAIGADGDADYRAATLVTAGASVLLSGWHLLGTPPQREERTSEGLAGRPDVLPIWMADGRGNENAGVKMVWTF